MVAKYADTGRLAKLEANFWRQFYLFKFSENFKILLWKNDHSKSAKKCKKYQLDTNPKNFTIEIT